MTKKLDKVKKAGLFKLPGDLIVYAVLIVLTASLIFYVLNTRESGKYVVVYKNNMLYAQYELDIDARYDIDDDMILVIENGVVWVEASDCPDKICQAKRISKTNDPIYCLPNRISIVIYGDYFDDPYGSDV